MRTTMLAWAGRSVVSAIGSLSATEMKRSGIEVRNRLARSPDGADAADWHAVRAYRIREILYGKYRKGIP